MGRGISEVLTFAVVVAISPVLIVAVILMLFSAVAVGSLTIAAPILSARLEGEHARAVLDSARGWLTEHNAAVLGAPFLVFGVDLVAKGLPPLTS